MCVCVCVLWIFNIAFSSLVVLSSNKKVKQQENCYQGHMNRQIDRPEKKEKHK